MLIPVPAIHPPLSLRAPEVFDAQLRRRGSWRLRSHALADRGTSGNSLGATSLCLHKGMVSARMPCPLLRES